MANKETYTAKIIKKYCAQKGLSLKDLASMVNMTHPGLQSSISKNTLKVETLYSIAQIFNVSISDFFQENYQRLDSNRRRIVDVQKILSEIEEKKEIIEFLKGKVNDFYNLYWSFQQSLDEEDTALLHENEKLHKFEMGVVFTIQEILAMVAETKEEREKLHSLIAVASKKHHL